MIERFGFAIVTNSGIQFRGNFYSCSSAIRERWFEFSWCYGSWEVPILFENNNLSRIYLFDNLLGERETCNVIVRQSESGEKLERYFESIQKLKTLRKSQYSINHM
jgi:hypothetical protein